MSSEGSPLLSNGAGVIRQSWTWATLRQVVTDYSGGSSILKLEYGEGGIPVLAKGDIKQFGRIEHSGRFISPEIARRRGYRRTKSGDFLLATRDLTQEANFLGLFAPVPESQEFIVNQGANLIRLSSNVDGRFIVYWCNGPIYRNYVKTHYVGSTQIHLRKDDFLDAPLLIPPLPEQRAIADVLGAFDDKIDANTAIRRASRHLGLGLFDQALERSGSEVTIGDLAESLTRGVAPKYTDPGLGVRVLNQKCIRDGWASVEAARWMQDVPLSDAKKAHRHDVVVNSTGVGTLGRVARWLERESIAVDGHVTVVRPDAARYPPVAFGYAMLAAQPQIEALGEGSTGQTELSRERLASLRIDMPSASEADQIATSLEVLDDHAECLLRESRVLAALRDTLLPQLLSGELRVRKAEELVGETV